MGFSVLGQDGGARTGELLHRGGKLQTPALLLYTRRGSPLYLTPDVLQYLGSQGQNLLLDATHFLGNPTPQTLAKAPGSGRGFCALDEKLLVVTCRDTLVYNYRHWKKGTNAGVRVDAFAGGQALGPELYHRVAELFRPDLLVPLCDEVPAGVEHERLTSSVRRSLRWLDYTLAACANSEVEQAAILAPIQGGCSVPLRRQSAIECAKREGVFGFALCGMGTGETAQQRRECVAAALEAIPRPAFKLLQGGLTPAEILDAVAQGVDCFDATYATQVTAAGYALDFETEPEAAAAGQDDCKLSLYDAALREDAAPLVAGCACFTCCSHTRAYLHHLALAHEMGAQVLLELHNLHQLLLFGGRIRAAITEARFSEFRERFNDRRRRYRGAGGA